MNKKVLSILALSAFLSMNLISISNAEYLPKDEKSLEQRKQRQSNFSEALKTLEDEGIFSKDDIENIKEYKTKLKRDQSKKEGCRKHTFIEKMTEDKVINKDQAKRLIKELENKNN